VIQQRFENPGSQAVPFSIGLHPYFPVLGKVGLELSLPATQSYNQWEQSWIAPGNVS
jgi:galactose mutarotase-like enzyme